MAKVGVIALIGVFVLFYVINSPANAAAIVHNVWSLAIHQGWNALVNIAHGIAKFIDNLTS
jgi:hypothetical protein